MPSIITFGSFSVIALGGTTAAIAAVVPYGLTAGSRAPTLGASSVPSWPPTNYVSDQTTNADDNNYVVSLPFTFYFNGTAYTSTYVGSNFYLTFGGGSSQYSGLSPSAPALDKIMFVSGDHSWQRVGHLTTNNYMRVRFEGSNSTSGTGGASQDIYEATFLNPSLTNNLPTIEMRLGVFGVTSGVTGIYSASGTNLTSSSWTPTANTSYVIQSTNTTGTSWNIYSNYYIANIV